MEDNPSEKEESLERSLMPGIQQLVRGELSRRHTKGSSTSQPQSQQSKSKSKDHCTSKEDTVQQPAQVKDAADPRTRAGHGDQPRVQIEVALARLQET